MYICFWKRKIWLWKWMSFSLYNIWDICINEIQCCCSGGTRWAVGLMNSTASSKRRRRGGTRTVTLQDVVGVQQRGGEKGGGWWHRSLMNWWRFRKIIHASHTRIYSSARPSHAASEWCMRESAINRGGQPTDPAHQFSRFRPFLRVTPLPRPVPPAHDDYQCMGTVLFGQR